MEVRKVKYTAERFMEEVQKYECLYNKYSEDFKYRKKKSNAWNAVVKATFHLTSFDIPMRPMREDQRHRRRFTR